MTHAPLHDRADEEVARFLVRRFRRERSHTEETPACPGENLLAGSSGPHLLDEERRLVEAHRRTCATCRALLAAVGNDLAGEARGGGRPEEAASPWRRLLARDRVPLAIAAGLLMLLGVGWLLRKGATRPQGTEARLVAAAKRLTSDPGRDRNLFQLLDGFRPLDREERRSGPWSVSRGALRILRPGARTLSSRPRMAWEEVAAGSRYRVSLSTAAGDPIWSLEAAQAQVRYPEAEPSLAPGRYLLEVQAQSVLGQSEGRLVFEVSDEAQATAFRHAMDSIERRISDPVRELLQAHFAIRSGYLEIAEEKVRSFLRLHPRDPVALETLEGLVPPAEPIPAAPHPPHAGTAGPPREP